MDGGANDKGYAARIEAAFRELKKAGSRGEKRLGASGPEQSSIVIGGENTPVDVDTQGAPDGSADQDRTGNSDASAAEVRDHRAPGRRVLRNISFGMRRSAAAPAPTFADFDDEDALDDMEPVEPPLDRDSERYATADAVYDFDEEEDVLQSAEGEPNLEYFADRSALLLLTLQNSLITILTLGTYRVWAQRQVRRFLWSAVSFQGESPDFQGRGTDSALAFMLVFAMVLGLTGLLIIAPQIFVPLRPVTATLELFFLAGLFLTYQVWLQWRRRYNLDHTAWHGIRFERLPQSPRRLLPLLGVWSLVLLTAGMAYPLARVIAARDLFRDVRFGPASVVIDANAQPLLLPWAIVYGTLLSTFIVVGTDLVFDYQTASGLGILLYWGGSMFLILASFGAVVWYKCGEFDYFVSNIYVGQSRAYTDLPAWRVMMKAALPVFGFLIYVLSIFLFAFFAFDAFLQLTAEELPTEVHVNWLFIGLGFAATLIGGFIYQLLLNLFRLDMLALIAETGSID